MYAPQVRPLEYYLDKKDLEVLPAQRHDCCILRYTSRTTKFIWGISPAEMKRKIKEHRESKLPIGLSR